MVNKGTVIDRFSRGYEFLSNFYPASVFYEGNIYTTVEHAYQAAKTTNLDLRSWIASAPNAGQAKFRGRSVKQRPHWDKMKLVVMRDLLVQKFSKPKLRALLMETGKAKLVDGNDWNDTYWGVCRGVGSNHLGELLMSVREEIRQAPKKT